MSISNVSDNMADYMRNHRNENRQRAAAHLGGCCNKCSLPDDGSHQFDHIDPTTKDDTLSNMWSLSWHAIFMELIKCQLLCENCHLEKTLTERNQTEAKGTHGTLSSYRYCKCDECRAAKAQWTRDYRARVGRKS